MNEENLYKTPESDLEIASGESPLVYAGFWIRAGASIIDSIFIMIITAPLVTLVYGVEYWGDSGFVSGTWDILISYVLPAVVVVLFWHYKSATPGKMIVGIEVISLGESRRLGIAQSIFRYLGYYLSTIILMLGFIWVAFDSRKQGWHDKIANTAVVKKVRT